MEPVCVFLLASSLWQSAPSNPEDRTGELSVAKGCPRGQFITGLQVILLCQLGTRMKDSVMRVCSRLGFSTRTVG